ncbi:MULTISPECIES: NAD(P)-dependent oxidoreductase [unclassified Leptospira]|uniref:NAD(P)-dependent oxidoreductase n=1 Tax=unclassified Leptospira TaxID=2633828 RepID=UPI0002BE733A|nr:MULTISPECIES: NAD(P)-dependent oxidoreductase [unclassified Leptospira]EMK01386.1 4-phosphoerythronate dehydrogenase [Leptospira sp. B5-022]MCR1794965.1 phosphoglycerate dehydrogenase [Leptospira sp. id769339]
MSLPILFYPEGTVGASEIFSYFRNLDIRSYPAKSPEEIEIFKPTILIANTRLKVNRETCLKFPSVKIFATVSSGTDHVNFSDLKKESRVFINSPGSNAGSVAEYCWVSLLHFFSEEKLRKKNVGIIGFGNTGKKFAKILEEKRVPHIYNDPFIKDRSQPIDEILKCQIVSLHVPLTFDGPYPTVNLLDKDKVSKLKEGTLLLNTSRGEVWSEETFQTILDRKDLYKVMDVFSPEPPKGKIAEQMADLENSIFTPHIAGYSQLGRLLGTYRLAEKLCILYKENPLPPLSEFLQPNQPISTETFLKEEDRNLRESWKNQDWEYFERRRNSYPARKDLGLADLY